MNIVARGPGSRKDGGPAAPPSDDHEMICGCFDLTLGAYRAFLRANPDIGFDEMMRQTKAGTRCTACSLDLEYHYVETLRAKDGGALARAKVGVGAEPVAGAKAAFYRAVDEISPQVPFPFSNVMPVVAAAGIEQFVCVDNHSLLYEGEICAPDTDIALEVRDSEGRLRARHEETVSPEQAIRVNVSRHLAPPRSGLGLGTVTIRRRAAAPGYRGVTRPQIEIVTSTAACALHSQAATDAPEGWFTCLHRPGEERIFLTLVNAGDGGLPVELSYPISDGTVPWPPPMTHVVVLPARGARIHEIALPADRFDHLKDAPIQIRWRASGRYKVHALCATPALDRFSIDHL